MTAPIVLQHNPSILALPVGIERPANGDGLPRSRAWLNTHNGMGERVAPEGYDPRTPHPDAIGATSVPGTLWQRVAEGRTINYDVYPWRCLNAADGPARTEDNRGPAVCVAPRFTVGRHMCPVPQSHGILRPDVIR